MNNQTTYWILATSFLLASAGFLLPLWPLSVAGVLIAALSGRFAFAIAVGFLLDLGFGPPVGLLHFLYFPFALLALIAVGVRYTAIRYLLPHQTEHL